MITDFMIEKMALKELVDEFSILADEKNVAKQVTLFTEDANLISYVGDKKVSHQTGREKNRNCMH